MNIDFTEKDMLLILRKRKAIKQQEVAEALKVTQGYVSNFEINRQFWSNELYENYKKFIENY